MGMFGATLTIYTGAMPASPEGAVDGIPLVVFTNLAYSPAVNGVASLSANRTATATDTGTAGYARWYSGGHAIDMTVGVGGGDARINTYDILSGEIITLSYLNVAQPAF